MGLFGIHAYKQPTDQVAKHGARWLRSEYASWGLAIISFAESVFAPILIDPFLIALIVANPNRWRWYVVVSVVASVIGGVVAYLLGALFFDTFGLYLLELTGLSNTFANISASVSDTGFVFVLLGAFTPIPYKLVALASGLLHINFMTFLIASVIGRILRLGLVGLAAHAVGPQTLPVVRRHLHHIAAAVGLILVAYLVWSLWLS